MAKAWQKHGKTVFAIGLLMARTERTYERTNERLPSHSKTPLVPDAPNPKNTSVWLSSELSRIANDAAGLTPEYIVWVCERFRNQVGGAYEMIAARIETDHRQ